METTSPILARFLAAQAKLHQVETQRETAEQDARHLRSAEQLARVELKEAQLALECLDQNASRQDPPLSVGTPDLKPDPAPKPAPAARPSTKHVRPPWHAGRPLPESLVTLLEAFASHETLSFAQLKDRIPEVPPHVLRSRVGHAKKYDLLAGVGWGKYRLSELGTRALQGGLRVVD